VSRYKSQPSGPRPSGCRECAPYRRMRRSRTSSRSFERKPAAVTGGDSIIMDVELAWMNLAPGRNIRRALDIGVAPPRRPAARGADWPESPNCLALSELARCLRALWRAPSGVSDTRTTRFPHTAITNGNGETAVGEGTLTKRCMRGALPTGAFTVANAATSVNGALFPVQSTSWSQDCTLNRFGPWLGTQTGVRPRLQPRRRVACAAAARDGHYARTENSGGEPTRPYCAIVRTPVSTSSSTSATA